MSFIKRLALAFSPAALECFLLSSQADVLSQGEGADNRSRKHRKPYAKQGGHMRSQNIRYARALILAPLVSLYLVGPGAIKF